MAQMEIDLGTKLAWVAVEHDNTDRYHAHILLRGVRLNEYDRNGKCLTLGMPRDYVSHGIREISQELIQLLALTPNRDDIQPPNSSPSWLVTRRLSSVIGAGMRAVRAYRNRKAGGR
jgi:hypothetical protein